MMSGDERGALNLANVFLAKTPLSTFLIVWAANFDQKSEIRDQKSESEVRRSECFYLFSKTIDPRISTKHIRSDF